MADARPPTDKQLAFARRIAEERRIELPAEVEESGAACSAWLDQQVGSRDQAGGGGAGGGRPPSEKQLAFARRLADERGIEVPEEVLDSSKAISQFIDEMLNDGRGGGGGGGPGGGRAPARSASPSANAGAGRPPTDKQLAFARKLSAEKKLPLPPEAERDGRACSTFIDRALGKG
ncbi:hypothetical protein [Zavarzinia sp. CC-PAN008]|uniref:hypothetical protein n=1 Tax=Zavarzinia sp. CC-PAN008 TaxID=3243332 RepID=UPI003F743D2B